MRRPRTSSTTGVSDSDCVSSSDGDSSDFSSGGDGDIDDDDDDDDDRTNPRSVSLRDQAGGAGELKARARARRYKAKRRGGLSDGKDEAAGENSSSSDDDSEVDVAVSRKFADACITESMSVTPSSSVAVGSLMGRSLGNAMASSFADDGLAWGRGGTSGVEDAFFHENVSSSISPPMGSVPGGIGSRSGSIDMTSRRALF